MFDFEHARFELPVAHSSACLMIYTFVDTYSYPPTIWMTYKPEVKVEVGVEDTKLGVLVYG